MSNFKIEFEEPVNIDGKEIKELEFREPIGEDMEALIGVIAEGGVKNVGKAITVLAERCIVSAPLDKESFRALPAKAYIKIAGEFSPFLPQM